MELCLSKRIRHIRLPVTITLCVIALVTAVNIVYAVPSGPTWEDSYEMSFDRTEYKPGDTVIIKVINTFYSGTLPEVTIRKATFNDVVYKEQKHLTNGTVEFRYQIPPDNGILFIENTQRYTVILNEPYYYGDTPIKTQFFTVKNEGASAFPLIFGIGAAVAGSIAFLTLRKRRYRTQP